MSLHPVVLAELLAAEADVARDRHESRVHSIEAHPAHVDVSFTAQGQRWRLRLSGPSYDRLPLSVSFLDDDRQPLPAERWPADVPYGALHPVLGTPWVCLRGTLEYHLYPGHTAGEDSWDTSRDSHRVADVIDHLLSKCGA